MYETVLYSHLQVGQPLGRPELYSEPAAGGHFFALEQPGVLVDDVRATFALLR